MADLVVCLGDSLTWGSASETGTPYHQNITNRSTSEWRSYAIGGAFLDVITAATLATYGLSGENVLVIWAGTNPIMAGSQTGAQAFAAVDAYRATMQAAGWLVVVCTLQQVPTNDAERLLFNTAVNGSTDFDAIADLGARAELDDCTDLTYFNADQTHLTDAGYAAVTATVQAALETL